MLSSGGCGLRTWVRCRAALVRSCGTKSHQSSQAGQSSSFVDCLRSHGFPDDVSHVLVTRMEGLKLGQTQLNKTLVSWSSCQFGQDRLAQLLSTNPSLLLADSASVINSFTFLSSLFTPNYVFKILFNSPDVLYQNETEVTAKLNFLNKTIGLPNAQIVNSKVLSHPLSYLRARHAFLERAGAYKLVSAGSKGKTAALSNPTIENMFDTTDEQFAKRVARLSLVEFEVFLSLYSQEEEDKER